jgi:hypothetical protein
MKLETQVVSLDLSKRLRELGVGQRASLYYWIESTEDATKYELVDKAYWRCDCDFEPEAMHSCDIEEIASDVRGAVYDKDVACAAFTVAELGVMIGKQPFHTYRNAGEVQIQVPFAENFDGETEANARASMLIFMLRSKIIAVEEVNARLEAA